MKHLNILLLFFLVQDITFSQTPKKTYTFKVEVIGKGKPLIFIPGTASSGEVWKETVTSLKKKYQCHILTLPGFAKQQPINLDKGFLPIIENEITQYIKTELNEKPVLIGHSLGGFLSLSISINSTNLLSNIVIVDSYPFGPLLYNSKTTAKNIELQAKQIKEMLVTATEEQFIAQQKAALKMMITDSTHTKQALKWSLESDRATIAQATFELMTTDLRNKIKNISIPMLILGSWYGLKNYGISKENVETQFKEQFSNAQNCKIKIAATAKHFIMLDDPNWVINSIINHI